MRMMRLVCIAGMVERMMLLTHGRLAFVVTVDTMVVHLAGALGLPTLLLLRRHADWRWMDDRTDTPWYPSVRLLRQVRDGEWDVPLAKLRATIRAAD